MSGATLEEWLAANGADPETQMYEGDELCIPAGAQAPTAAARDDPTRHRRPGSDRSARRHGGCCANAREHDTCAGSRDRRDARSRTRYDGDSSSAATARSGPADPPGRTVHRRRVRRVPTQNGSTTAGPAEVEAIIREIWPDDIEVRALCIAKREANLRPDLNNCCCYGVFAIYFDYIPATEQQLASTSRRTSGMPARTSRSPTRSTCVAGGTTGPADPGSGSAIPVEITRGGRKLPIAERS